MLIVSSRLLQGRLREAIAEIDSVGDIDAFAQDDEVNCVGLKMTRAFMNALSTMRYAEAFEVLKPLYEHHLSPKIPGALVKQKVGCDMQQYLR